MIQIKKTILTLVALLAVTGAWAADVLNLVVDGTSATIKYDGNANNNPILGSTDWEQSGYGWDEEYTTRPTITTVTIDESCKNFSGTSLHGLLFWFSGLTTINGLENLNTANVQDMEYMFAGCSKLTSLDLSSFNTASVTTMFCMFEGCSKLTTVDLSSWNTENVEKINALFNECSELTTVDLSSWNTAKVWNTGYMFYNCSKLENIYVGDGWSTTKVTNSSSMFDGCTKLLSMNTANPAIDKTNAHTGDGGYLKVKPASSGPEVAWTAASNTGTFKMPGGNVTLEPEYYPQAALATQPTAINDVPATTDGAIVEAGTVATIGETTTAQGTVMYYVSPTELDDAALLALAADKWTADVPTAAGLAQGQAYVYYYVRGNDSDTDAEIFSDGDILAANALTVTIAAEPTYAVTFAEGVNPVPPAEPEWTASPAAGVKKGETVTVTYTGSKKVIGVKAEKKGEAVENAYQKWDADQKKLVATEIPTEAIMVTSSTTTWSAGTYVVEGEVNITGTITLSGDVNLIIKDGATLTAQKIFGGNNKLYIYGQAQMTGELVVDNSGDDATTSIKTLEVHSAKVKASSSYNNRGAFYYTGTINVYGGSVDATAANGYGIWLRPDGSINIYGGEVKAVGKGTGNDSYGIKAGNSSTVTVNGGKLWAENANKQALHSNVTLKKGDGFSGKIEYSSDKSTWSETVDANAKYVRVGY